MRNLNSKNIIIAVGKFQYFYARQKAFNFRLNAYKFTIDMENIFTLEFCVLYFDKTKEQMRIVWTAKLLTNENFKSHLKVFGEKALQYHPQSLFVDARLHRFTVPAEIQKWHDETIMPIYLQAGIKKIAFLTPESIFAEVTTKKVFQQDTAKQHLPSQFFHSEGDAMNWIKMAS